MAYANEGNGGMMTASDVFFISVNSVISVWGLKAERKTGLNRVSSTPEIDLNQLH